MTCGFHKGLKGSQNGNQSFQQYLFRLLCFSVKDGISVTGKTILVLNSPPVKGEFELYCLVIKDFVSDL